MAKGFNVNFTADYEDIKPEYQFSEKEDIDFVKEQIENDNLAAWFCAKVEIECEGVASDAEYLGCCSYSSFDEFTGEDSGYFDDMLKACFDNLKEKSDKLIAAFIKAN